MDILSAAARYDMFRHGDRVLVAVSGGADSIALLHALHSRSVELGISISVAHFNHCIRGADADADEEFVRRFAAAMGLDFGSARGDVPAEARRLAKGIEETGRLLRYRFLHETATTLHCNRIALGHTADDRAETLLLNVIRGAGIDGLASIQPVRGSVVRPLIDTRRTAVESYCELHALPYRTDATNSDTAYARNRVRAELIPMLERDFNPQVRSALDRLAALAEMVGGCLGRVAEQERRSVCYAGGIDAGLLSISPPALQYEIVRHEIHQAQGSPADLSMQAVQRVVEALGTGRDFKIALPSGALYAVRGGYRFNIQGVDDVKPAPDFDHALLVPGVTHLPEIEVDLTCDLVDRPSPGRLPSDEALVDADTLQGELRARNLRPGDRIRPLGMSGTKKLQDILVDRKVPRQQRGQTAVVVDDEKIVWVVGIVVSEDARVTENTRRAIRICAAPAR